jgi:DNA-binding NarL/FixJ family response regulator
MRIVLADDHPIVRAGLKALLEARGITVVGEAANGRAALELALETKPDVVVMDLSMPEVDGIAATKSITTALPKTRVLVLTTFASEADAVRALDAGATGYLLKDTAPDEIIAAVRNIALGQSVLAPAVATAVLNRVRGGTSSLTTRELEILQHVADGRTNKETAKALKISEATVKTHLLHAFEKLGVDDRTAAVTVAIQRGILNVRK